MKELSDLPRDATTPLRGRQRFTLQLLGVGLFVSAYVHIAAGPALYGVATSDSVRLFAPAQSRSSVELTMSLASRASEASAETAVRLESSPEVPQVAEAIEQGRETLAADPIVAAPTTLVREEPLASQVSLPLPVDPTTEAPAFVPPQADRPAPRPLDRRGDETAPRSASRASETSSPARVATADSAAQTASTVRLGAESEGLPELVSNRPPEYPAEALRRGIEGTTIVRARISRTGSVLSASVASTSGSPLLDQAAEVAVRGWTFSPGLRFGLAVEMEVGVPVVFSIREAQSKQREGDASPGGAVPR